MEQNRRLDAQPYISGAIEARVAVEQTGLPKDRLVDVTKDGSDGIFHAGRESRTWVTDPKYGIPFLGSSKISYSDLSTLPLISQKIVERNQHLLIQEGWTLITRSGTIGRMAYSRPDMKGIACSEHVMRVVPDSEKIPPGYLFAFLRSSFGVPLVVSGTYGSIIQHIEPEHIRDLAVPRLGAEREAEVHALVQAAADDRTEAHRTLDAVKAELQVELGFGELQDSSVTGYGITTIPTSRLDLRFDAHYHCAKYAAVADEMEKGPFPVVKIGDIVKEHFRPPRFARIWVSDPIFGCQFISGNDAFKFEADEPRYITRLTQNFERYILRQGEILFQAAGQLYGLFGRPLFIWGWTEGLFCSEDMYRIVPHSIEDGAYLFLFFNTPPGQVLFKRLAAGTSIPRVMEPQINHLRIPWPPAEIRARYAARVIEAHEMLDRALQSERKAIALVESSIRETVKLI
ncbi:methylation-associated defense system restriction endonuclease subunit S MAD5 [Methanosphaerula subterraneus]|uniref:methylation-associated defense system restriction endonuclease subunit S MAD5 n=1 Tax=Methanosphaerula subterraneus TaxID=3350244 RepID=UPI003F841AF4